MAKSAQKQEIQPENKPLPEFTVDVYCVHKHLTKLDTAIMVKLAATFGTGTRKTMKAWDDFRDSYFSKK